MGKWAIGVLVFLFAILAAAFLAPSFVDVNSYKPEIARAAKEATGRDLAIDGPIGLSLLPAPTVTIDSLRLANLSGGSQPDMLRLQQARVAVALWPLLSGNIKVTSVRLVKPEVLLESLADGRANWRFLATEPAAGAAAQPAASGGGFALSLDDVRIEQGVLRYRDAKAGSDERIEAIDLAGSAGSLAGPFAASGGLTLRGTPLAFELRAGTLAGAQPVPLTLALRQAESSTKFDFQGVLNDPAGKAEANGKLKLQVANLAQLAQRLLASELPAPLAQALSLEATLAGNVERLQASDLQLGLGDMKASGGLLLRLQPKPAFEVALSSNKFDLDGWLAAAAKVAPAAPKSAPAGERPAPFAIDPELTGSVKLAIEGVTLYQQAIRQVQLVGSVAGGQIRIDKAGALLPGGSDIALSGAVQARAGKPIFDGRVELAADNLRGLLNWLKLDVNQVPQGRLGNLSLTSGLKASAEELQLAGINLRLDSSTLTGNAAYQLQSPRPSFALDLAIDKFNVDGYLPDAAPAKAGDKSAGSPLAALEQFDASIKLKVGQLTYNRIPVDGAQIDAMLRQGRLEVSNASVRNLAGSSAALAGTFANLARKPAVRASASIASNDLTGLTRLAGLELPFAPAKLGRSEIKASVDGEGDAIKLAVAAVLGATQIELGGNLAGLAGQPSFNLSLDAQHRSLEQLAALFDLGLRPQAGSDGPVSLKGTLKGKPSAIDLDLSGGVAGGLLKVAGQVGEANGQPNLKLALNASHPDAVRLLRGLGADFQPALGNFGGLQLAGSLAGSAATMELAGLKGNFGPLGFTGNARAELERQPRPRLVAKLQTSEIVTDFFAAPAAPAGAAQPGRAAASPAERWSREPLRLDDLSAFDADLELTAPKLVSGEAVLSDPRLNIQVKDGVLTVPSLMGRLFDGQLEGRAQLAGQGKPQLAATLNLSGANLEAATREGQAPGKATGQFGFKLDLKGTGASQWDLVNNLNGAFRFGAERGVVRGANLRQLSDRLKNLSGGLDYLDLINRAFAGGETSYSTIAASFVVVNGIARTQDGQALLDAATANFQGVVNLVTWSLDIKGDAKLSEHPAVPPVGIRYHGSLDDPQREIGTRELEAYLAQRVGGELLRKGLGDKAGPLGGILGGKPATTAPQPAPQPSATPAPKPSPSDPKQAIPGLLKDLLKR